MKLHDTTIRPTTGGLLSVVIPCHNEEEVIRSTHRRLTQILPTTEMDFEVIYVDDGSRDRTIVELERIAAVDPRVTIVELSRNFGQQAAMSIGLGEARGDAVVLLDADLQDPPEVIPMMLTRWRKGVDVVYGQRRSRDGESFFKLVTAKLFHRLFRKLVPYPMPVDTGDFKLLDRTVVDAIRRLPEKRRYMRSLIGWSGFRQEPFLYDREARSAGKTKYSPLKLVNLALDAVMISSDAPLRGVWIAAGMLAAMALVASATAVLSSSAASGIVAGLAAIGAIQVAATAIVGEYAVRTYREAQGRPTAVTRRVLGQRDLASKTSQQDHTNPPSQAEHDDHTGSDHRGRRAAA